jgi:hypothetical protein
LITVGEIGEFPEGIFNRPCGWGVGGIGVVVACVDGPAGGFRSVATVCEVLEVEDEVNGHIAIGDEVKLRW